MAETNRETVEKCAALARLEITPEEAERLSADFARILEAFRGLSELDVSDVEPSLGPARLENVLREDRARPSLSTEELLAPAPRVEDGFFSVPKTVDPDP
jgi:aspartyl-tRNA(Asn)/glutamyl-tRNA(Gln) amidotransferase subunit C